MLGLITNTKYLVSKKKLTTIMISRLLAIFRMFPRASASRNPNSWAELCLWRRVLFLEENNDNNNIDEHYESIINLIEESCCDDLLIIEPDDNNDNNDSVVSSANNKVARKEFLLDHYRRYKKQHQQQVDNGAIGTVSTHTVASINANNNSLMGARELQQLHEPNLDIPINNGSSYITLAQ